MPPVIFSHALILNKNFHFWMDTTYVERFNVHGSRFYNPKRLYQKEYVLIGENVLSHPVGTETDFGICYKMNDVRCMITFEP